MLGLRTLCVVNVEHKVILLVELRLRRQFDRANWQSESVGCGTNTVCIWLYATEIYCAWVISSGHRDELTVNTQICQWHTWRPCNRCERGRCETCNACRSRAKAHMKPLVRGEEEQLVLTTPHIRHPFAELRQIDWTTDIRTATEEIEAGKELRPRYVALTNEPLFLLSRIKSVQIAITHEAIDRTVVVVCARLGDSQELTSVRATKLRWELVL